jgi:hypothetical protein
VIFFEKIICSYKNIAITLHQFMTLIKMSSLFNKNFMYKKKFFYGIAVLGVAAVAAWNVSLNSQQSNKLSDTMLANVEAFADGETTVQYFICNVGAASDTYGAYVKYCGSCDMSNVEITGCGMCRLW